MAVERAFSADSVRRLTGLSKRQLQYWEDTGLVRPSLSRPEVRGRGRPRLYDFRDLVELKAVADLRALGISLQLIRRVRDHLRSIDYEKPLSELTFEVVDGGLYLRESGTVRRGRRPDQTVIPITITLPLPAIVARLKVQVAALDVRTPGTVERRRGALGGKPLIVGTRIPVGTVRRLVRLGLDLAAIQELYPGLTAEDVAAATADADGAPVRRAG